MDFEAMAKVYATARNLKGVPAEFTNLLKMLDSLPQEDQFVPFHLHCYNCGKLAKLKCGKCKTSRYCSKECQISHWPVHRKGCKVDSQFTEKIPKIEAKMFCFDESCFHGAPALNSAYHELASSVVSFVSKFSLAKMAAGKRIGSEALLSLELNACIDYCFEYEAFASLPQAPQILCSMALEAFMDSNGGQSREFLRCAVFFECFALEGVDFIQRISTQHEPVETDSEAAVPVKIPGQDAFDRYLGFLDQTMSRRGLVEALKARVTCSCMTEKR